MPVVEVSFSPLPVHVRTARLVAAAAARRAGVSDELLDEVRLAVGEACSRAVRLHQRHHPDRPVRLLLEELDGRLVVSVLDAGPADPADGALPSVLGTDPDRLMSGAGAAGPGTADGSWAAGGGEPIDGAEPADGAGVAAGDEDGGDVLPPDFGLAVVAGLVDDLQIEPSEGGAGAAVRMSWPLAAPPVSRETAAGQAPAD